MTRALTGDEERALRAFQRQVQRLRESSIVKQGKVQLKKRTSINMPTGEVTVSFEGYDQELFQSQLPILRQFLLNDPIRFNRIHNIINSCCDRQELLDWTRYARKKWDERLAVLPSDVDRYLHQANLTVEEAIEKVFYGYGGLFHADIHEPTEDESIKAIQNEMLQHAFPYLCWCLNVYDSVINWWLDETGKPVPPVNDK